jgi:hypothetical protein
MFAGRLVFWISLCPPWFEASLGGFLRVVSTGLLALLPGYCDFGCLVCLSQKL